MRATKIQKRLIEFAPSVLTETAPADMHARCIRATRLGVDVLAKFGVIALPLPVIADVANKEYMAWIAAGCPGGNQGLLDSGGWLITNEPDPDGTKFQELPSQVAQNYQPLDMHLVVGVPEWRCIIDLDMRQFNRPAKGIVLPAAAALPWAENYAEGKFKETGSCVRYRLWPDLADKSYQATVSWTGTWVADAVARLEWRMRKGRLD